MGRLLVDTTDGPMRVTLQYDPRFSPPGASPPFSRTGELCTTPCAADLPFGAYRVFLASAGSEQRGDTDDLVIDAGLNVYRRAPGRYEAPTVADRVGPTFVLIAGMAAMLGGGILLAGDGDKKAPGVALLAIGVGVSIGGGVWLYDASRATTQRGATTFFRRPLP
jgi:hypothetical protein